VISKALAVNSCGFRIDNRLERVYNKNVKNVRDCKRRERVVLKNGGQASVWKWTEAFKIK